MANHRNRRHPISLVSVSSAALIIILRPIILVNSFEVPFPPSPAEIRAVVAPTFASAPTTRTVRLEHGTIAQVISCVPLRRPPRTFFSSLFGDLGNERNHDKPVLVFLHGSFHASWCWSEYYMPYFAGLGYSCFAPSLQGTGGTPAIPEGVTKVKVSAHVADLDAFLKCLSSPNDNLGLKLGQNPRVVLIGHSFGGLTIMKWLEHYYKPERSPNNASNDTINLAGVGLLCSVPPGGIGPMTLRCLLRSPSDCCKITLGFAMKKVLSNRALCRELFFGGDAFENGISEDDLERYRSYFARDTVATIDLADLANRLPSLLIDKDTGNAPFANDLKELPIGPFVMGASADFIVDEEGVKETGRYLGLGEERIVYVDSPHDVMLGNNWILGAAAIRNWIEPLRV